MTKHTRGMAVSTLLSLILVLAVVVIFLLFIYGKIPSTYRELVGFANETGRVWNTLSGADEQKKVLEEHAQFLQTVHSLRDAYQACAASELTSCICPFDAKDFFSAADSSFRLDVQQTGDGTFVLLPTYEGKDENRLAVSDPVQITGYPCYTQEAPRGSFLVPQLTLTKGPTIRAPFRLLDDFHNKKIFLAPLLIKITDPLGTHVCFADADAQYSVLLHQQFVDCSACLLTDIYWSRDGIPPSSGNFTDLQGKQVYAVAEGKGCEGKNLIVTILQEGRPVTTLTGQKSEIFKGGKAMAAYSFPTSSPDTDFTFNVRVEPGQFWRDNGTLSSSLSVRSRDV